MYKGIITNKTVTANTNIPFTTTMQSNGKTVWNRNDNTVQITASGYYEVNAQLVLTGVAVGNVTASLMGNGTSIMEAQSITTVGATTDYHTLNIHDVLKVNPSNANVLANLGIQLSEAGTVESGVITVQAVR